MLLLATITNTHTHAENKKLKHKQKTKTKTKNKTKITTTTTTKKKSMYPLLKKDGLVMAYFASMFYWAYLSAGVSEKYGRVSRLMKGIMRVRY